MAKEGRPEVRMRKCLGPGCGKEFLSRGPFNRICSSCSRKLEGVYIPRKSNVDLEGPKQPPRSD